MSQRGQNQTGHGALLKSRAIRRLMTDWKEIQTEPLPTITAYPNPANIFEWHCNVRPLHGVYKGIVFHIELHFPEDYPHNPPSILLCEVLPHPKTFFCLNMLRPLEYGQEYSGWSTAYSAQAILLQLQSFLFGENMEQDGGYTRKAITDESAVTAAKRRIIGFTCKTCGHSHKRPFPNLPGGNVLMEDEVTNSPYYKQAIKGSQAKETTKWKNPKAIEWNSVMEFPPLPGLSAAAVSLPSIAVSVTQPSSAPAPIPKTEELECFIEDLPKELLLEIFNRLGFNDLVSLTHVCKRFSSIISSCALFQRRELVCYHSKASWEERELGYGVKLDKISDNQTNIRVSLDLLSANAFFEENLRMGIWKESFDYFLPIAINPNHAKRSEKVVMQTLRDMGAALKRPAFITAIRSVPMSDLEKSDACAILTVLPRLMNQMIVQILLDGDLSTNQKQMENRKLHIESSVSDKALLGYCTFHHLILTLMQSRPYIQKIIDAHIDRFMTFEKYRDKEYVPDLGEFLVLVSLSKYSWLPMATTVIREAFLRNVRWVLRASPFLRRINPGSCDQLRLDTFFKNSKTSQRLFMFQVYFMVQFGADSGKTQAQILERYNLSYGRPNEALKAKLAVNTRQMLLVNSWPEFFDRILIKCPSKIFMSKMLVSCQKEAMARPGYHDSAPSSPSKRN